MLFLSSHLYDFWREKRVRSLNYSWGGPHTARPGKWFVWETATWRSMTLLSITTWSGFHLFACAKASALCTFLQHPHCEGTDKANRTFAFIPTQGSKFPPIRLPGTSRFSVGQPKTLSPLALWASRFWVQPLVKRCQPKAMISFSSTVGLVSCRPTPFQPFPSHCHLPHPPQLCSLTEKAKLSRWGAWRPRTHSMVSLVIIDRKMYFVTQCARDGAGEWYLAS